MRHSTWSAMLAEISVKAASTLRCPR
jgi:hypothetical protein